jgi:hypothetical protein
MPEQILELEIELAKAERHVVQAREIVARQRERVVALRRRGEGSAACAEAMLALFMTTLQTFEDHQRRLCADADDAVRSCCETDPLWFDRAAILEYASPALGAIAAVLETVAEFRRLSRIDLNSSSGLFSVVQRTI